MSYLNSRLRALFVAGLLLLGVSSLHAQDAPATGAIRGDVDGDGRVTRADAEAVRTFLVRGAVPGGRSILPAGDANGDGRVTAADAALISRYVAGVDVSRFPVGRPIDGGTGRAPTVDGRGMLLTQLECEFTVASETTTCRPVGPGTNGALADIVVGSPYVTVTASKTPSNGDPSNPDTAIVTFKVTNKIPQPIGTTDTTVTTPHPNGIRLFFNGGPTVTQVSSGALSTAKVWFDPLPDSATFTSAQGATYTNKKYIQYNKVLQQDSSAEQPVQLVHDSRVAKFAFAVLVATPVPFEHGWVDVTPLAAPVIAPDSTTGLAGTVRNQVGVTQADAKTWSSSNTAIATVDPNTGVVTGVSEGTAIITVTSSVNAQRTGSRNVTVDRFPQVDSTSPADNAEGVSPGSNILVYFSEPVTVLSAAAFDLECPAGSAQAFTISGSGTSTITLNPDADLPPGITCEVSVKGNQIEDVDTNDGPNFMPGQYDFDFLVSIEAVADVFGTTTTGNVRINSASTDPVFSVTTNDKLGPSTTISFAGWGGTPNKTMGGGDVVMDTEGAGMGTFTYNPPAGFEGTDSLEYTVQQGSMTSTARVALPVSGMIWFVNNAGAACTTRASGCGRLTNPYSSLAAFQAENNGTGNNPAAGDNIFLYQSGTSYTGPVALLGQQKLIGQDAGATLSTITGITPATGSDPLPAMDAAGTAVTINGAAGGVTLANIGATSGANNTVRGLTIATTGGAALSGTSFGSPVIEEVSISATGGPALSLNGGTVNSTFATASSVNSSTQGMSLTNLSGTLTFGSSTTLSNSTGTVFLVSGGSPTITFNGSLLRTANNALLVDLTSVASGSITFDPAAGTDSLYATTGEGIQLNNVDAAVDFNGRVRLAGASVGVDIIGGSTGNIDFDAATLVNTSGEALRIFNGGSATDVSITGSITSSGTGRPVHVEGVSSGTVAVSASIGATGQGLLVQNNTGGTVTFSNAAQTLNTAGSAAVSLLNNTGATVNFTGGTLDIDVTSGAGFTATGGGTVNVQGTNNTVNATSGGAAVNIQNTTIGGSGVRFSRVDAIGNSGNSGIVLLNTGAGSFEVSGDGASDGLNTTRGRTTARSGGGTIALGSGGTISGRTVDAVSLNTTAAVTLRNMLIQNNGGDGVQATSASGVTIDNTRITGHTDNSALFFTSVSAPVITHSELENNAFGGGAPGSDIHNVRLISNTGTGSVQNSVIANTSAGAERQLQVFSTTGTLNISVTNNRIGGSTIGDGVGVYAFGSSNITAAFQNDSIHNNSSFGIDAGTETTQSASLNISVSNTAFRNNFLGITVAHGSSGSNTFSITNNNFQTNVASSSQAININRLGGGGFTSFGLFSGTISGNTIGTAGVANSGSDVGDGITVKTNGNGGTTRVSILNNTIRSYGQHGISVLPRDANSGHTLHARIQNNNIAEGEAALSQDGINVTMGALNTDVISLCLDIGGAGGANGNTVTNAVRNGVRVRSSGLPAANVALTAPGYDGTGATYFANRNPGASGAGGNTSFSNANGTTTAGNCTTP